MRRGLPLIIIPARMQARRLPNKPMADIIGKPMIVHMVECAQAANLGQVMVATDHQDIWDAATKAGAKAVMTDSDLPSGSDRIMAALNEVDPNGAHDVIINLQGDMPTCTPEVIQTVAGVLADHPTADIATLVAPIDDKDEITNDAVVKADVDWEDDRQGIANDFMRTPVAGTQQQYHHVGIYAYRRQALETFVSLPQSALEQKRKLEQLRAMEHGMTIAVGKIDAAPLGVDTPQTLEQVRKQLSSIAK